MKKSLTPEQVEWAAARRREGHSLQKIANALYISKTALIYDLETSGLDYKKNPAPLKYEEDKKE